MRRAEVVEDHMVKKINKRNFSRIAAFSVLIARGVSVPVPSHSPVSRNFITDQHQVS